MLQSNVFCCLSCGRNYHFAASFLWLCYFEEYRSLRTVLRKVYGPKDVKLQEQFRLLHSEEFHGSYRSLSNLVVVW
jgi:hypothetical protein